MTLVTDVEIMRYADRTLGAAEHARIADLIAQDPTARERLAQFLETGRDLAGPYSVIANAPVPQHLVNIVMGADLGGENVRPARRATPAQGTWLDKLRDLLPIPTSGPLAWGSAMALSMIIGGTVVWFARDVANESNMLALVDGQVVAHGRLATAFESAPIGQKITVAEGGGDTVQMRLTFPGRNDDYCRQYVISRANGSAVAGIGCRAADGTWHVRYVAPTKIEPPASEKTKSADDAKAMIAAVVERMKDGDALEPEEEAEVLKRGWKR